MKKVLLIWLLSIGLIPANGQNFDIYQLRFPDDYQHLFPTDYSYVSSVESDKLYLIDDFNGDNDKDLACILTHDKTGETILYINIKTQIIYCSWGAYMHHDLKFKSGILEVFSDSGGMGVYGVIKMKYDKLKKQMVILSTEGVKNVKFKKWVPIVG